MMMDREKFQNHGKIIEFLMDCLSAEPSIADWDLIQDSQTRILLEHLATIQERIRLLDYGCGNLRVLNALLTSAIPGWDYVGYDPYPSTDTSSTEKQNGSGNDIDCSWQIMSREELLKNKRSFDVVLIQNVLHEVNLYEFAAIMEDSRILLRANGKLLIMETPVLPRGEPRFVPLFEWDMREIFEEFTDMSSVSAKGLPLLFASIPHNKIPHYAAALSRCEALHRFKRQLFAYLAQHLDKSKNETADWLVNLSKDRVFDYAYMNLVIGNITYRLTVKGG